MPNRVFLREISLVAALAILAVLVHGFHVGIEDEAIYLPAIKKQLTPGLYPYDSVFFFAQTRYTLFPELVAFMVRVTEIPLRVVLFANHVLSIFLVLLGCLHLSRECFENRSAHWGSVAMIAALLTIPVTGTALYIMDQHLHPRSLATAAILFSITFVLKKRLASAVLCMAAAGLIHAQMTFYGLIFLILFSLMRLAVTGSAGAAAIFAIADPGAEPEWTSEIWTRIIPTRTHHYPLKWPWHEWLGIVAPIVLLVWFSKLRPKKDSLVFSRLCLSLALFGALNTIAAIVLTSAPQFRGLANLQPMRSFQLVYLIFFLLLGGILGNWILKNKPLRWAVLFIPLCTGMFVAQRAEFPASPHIELAGRTSNDWLQAFDWIRLNTPRDAFFALDPNYMRRPGEDFHGFRALAERSIMADYVKDVAVVALALTARKIGADNTSGPSGVPHIWFEHMKALHGWKDFTVTDFQNLRKKFGVGWVVLEQPGIKGLECPYENGSVKVCRIP